MSFILVVDDEPYATRVLKLSLEGAGHRVEIASDGAQALEKLRTEAGFDVLITDVCMPRMNGRELCKTIRELNADDRPFIIVVTSRPEDEYRDWIRELTSVEFMEKPLSLRRLVERIDRLGKEDASDGDPAP